MIVDANLLLYAADDTSAFHTAAAHWLSKQLTGARRIAFPWQSLTAFLRISTHPRAAERPLSSGEAWTYVDAWLSAAPSWVPTPTDRHGDLLQRLVKAYQLRGNLISDADLVALAIEHGLPIASADTDFARFKEITWENPLW